MLATLIAPGTELIPASQMRGALSLVSSGWWGPEPQRGIQ